MARVDIRVTDLPGVDGPQEISLEYDPDCDLREVARLLGKDVRNWLWNKDPDVDLEKPVYGTQNPPMLVGYIEQQREHPDGPRYWAAKDRGDQWLADRDGVGLRFATEQDALAALSEHLGFTPATVVFREWTGGVWPQWNMHELTEGVSDG